MNCPKCGSEKWKRIGSGYGTSEVTTVWADYIKCCVCGHEEKVK